MESMIYKNGRIFFEELGNADKPVLVLLHGYLETSKIWENFIPLLTEDYYIICIDIPGHGKSDVISPVHEMDLLAESVKYILEKKGIPDIHIIGHSMGGYVALAFCHLFPQRVKSCVLFHSNCYSDTEEKKANRSREIELIRDGRLNLIINTNVPRAFAASNLDSMKEEVTRAKVIAGSSDREGIIALLEGMKRRPDRSDLLINKDFPVLLIAGKKDNYIPFEAAQNLVNTIPGIKLAVLENSGHMGFIEEAGISAQILNDFFKSLP